MNCHPLSRKSISSPPLDIDGFLPEIMYELKRQALVGSRCRRPHLDQKKKKKESGAMNKMAENQIHRTK